MTSKFLNISTDGTLSGNSDSTVVSEKAIKTYVDKKQDIIVAEQYTKSNLVPKVPVAFEKAQLTDFYTVVGSPTIVDGVASGFSTDDYLKLTGSFSTQNMEMVIEGTRGGSTSQRVYSATKSFMIYNSSQSLFQIRFTNENIFGSYMGVNDGERFRIELSIKNNVAEMVAKNLTRGTTGTTARYTFSVPVTVSDILLGQSAYANESWEGSIDLNNTYIKVNGKYLVPPLSSTVISVSTMTGATSSAAGTSGIVPAPSAGDNLKFLRGDGTWAASGGSANIDNKSITQNNDSQIQTIGVIDQNSGNAIKKWSGTEAEFEAITNKDLDTEYTIEDDENMPAVNSPSFSRNIGEIVPSILPLSDAGLHLLDGALISGSGSYSAFVDYIATLAGNYPSLFVSESSWQNSVNTYGVCGKFVYDASANTVRLPKVTGIIEGTTVASAIGDLVEAGLPNIIGTITPVMGGYNTTPTGTGAFQTESAGYDTLNGGNAGIYRAKVTLNAADSSSIFGASNTVQPQTIKAYYYIVIANTTKTEIQVDIDEVVSDLNGKADTDLGNVPSSKGILVESYVNGTSWYRVWSDGWCEQGGISSNLLGSNSETITLLKPYKDTNYLVVTSQRCTTSNMAATVIPGNYILSTSQIVLLGRYVANSEVARIVWETKGYIS